MTGPDTLGESFERFTERARKVMTFAQQEAERFKHNYIGTEHILLGLVREREGIAARVLSNLGVDLAKVRNAVEFIIGRGEHQVVGEIGLTPRAKSVLQLAVDEGRRLGHHYIGTEHLLLGLIREGEGIAAGVLESMGVSLERVRTEVLRVLSGGSLPPSPEPPPVVQDMTTRWEYLVVQTIQSEGSVRVHSVNGEEAVQFVADRTPIHEVLRVLGDEGWNLVGLDPATMEHPDVGACYIFKREVRS